MDMGVGREEVLFEQTVSPAVKTLSPDHLEDGGDAGDFTGNGAGVVKFMTSKDLPNGVVGIIPIDLKNGVTMALWPFLHGEAQG